MTKISLRNFRLGGDLFYTDAIRLYCDKAGVEYVSSSEEINMLELKVKQLINADKNCCISAKVDKEKLINNYFSALKLELVNREAYSEHCKAVKLRSVVADQCTQAETAPKLEAEAEL